MSIEPKIEKSSDVAVKEERSADRPRSTAEVARDLDQPEAREQTDGEEAPSTLFPENETNDFRTRWTVKSVKPSQSSVHPRRCINELPPD